MPPDPIQIAYLAVAKYGADADKPSVHLAKALIVTTARAEAAERDAVVVRDGHWDEVVAERDRLRAQVELMAIHEDEREALALLHAYVEHGTKACRSQATQVALDTIKRLLKFAKAAPP